MRDTPDVSNSSQKGHTPQSDQRRPTATSRRACLEGAGSTGVATAAVQALGSATADAADSVLTAPARTAISLTVNGVSHRVEVEDRWYSPEAVYFRVVASDGNRYVLCHDEKLDVWKLEAFRARGTGE